MRISFIRSALFKIPTHRKFEYLQRYEVKRKMKRGLKELKRQKGGLYEDVLKGNNKPNEIENSQRNLLNSRPARIISLIVMLSIALMLYIYPFGTFGMMFWLMVLVIIMYQFIKK